MVEAHGETVSENKPMKYAGKHFRRGLTSRVRRHTSAMNLNRPRWSS